MQSELFPKKHPSLNGQGVQLPSSNHHPISRLCYPDMSTTTNRTRTTQSRGRTFNMDSSSDRDKNPLRTLLNRRPTTHSSKFRQFADAQIGSLLQGIIVCHLPSPSQLRTPDGLSLMKTFEGGMNCSKTKGMKESEARTQNRQIVRRWRGNTCQEINRLAPFPRMGRPGTHQIPDANNEEMDPVKARDIPLYSPITKSLFAHLRRQPEGDDVDWKQLDQVETTGWVKGLVGISSLLSMKLDPMRTIQSMVYDELNRSSTLRSEYSSLPYLLFSPYSPIRLSTALQYQTHLCPQQRKYHRIIFPILTLSKI